MYRELVQSKLASKPEPQAQAGEPEVVAYVLNKENLLGTRLLGYKPDGEDCIELIALQSHREAMAELQAEVDKWSDRAAERTDDWHDAIAKKDAALQACVDGLQKARDWHKGDKWREGAPTERAAWESHRDMLDAAITQAEEAVGRSAL